MFNVLTTLKETTRICGKSFHTSSRCNLIQKWRTNKGLPMNPNACGVLTDKPDYTYLDGRSTPLGIRQRNRLFEQQEIANKIMQLSQEVDYAVERHKQMLQEHDDRVKDILENKLIEKGHKEL